MGPTSQPSRWKSLASRKAFISSQDGGERGLGGGGPSIEPPLDGNLIWRDALGLKARPSGLHSHSRESICCRGERIVGATCCTRGANMSISTTVSSLANNSLLKNMSKSVRSTGISSKLSSIKTVHSVGIDTSSATSMRKLNTGIGAERLLRECGEPSDSSHLREPHSSFRIPGGGDRPVRSLCTERHGDSSSACCLTSSRERGGKERDRGLRSLPSLHMTAAASCRWVKQEGFK